MCVCGGGGLRAERRPEACMKSSHMDRPPLQGKNRSPTMADSQGEKITWERKSRALKQAPLQTRCTRSSRNTPVIATMGMLKPAPRICLHTSSPFMRTMLMSIKITSNGRPARSAFTTASTT